MDDAIRARADQLRRAWGEAAPTVAARHLEQARERGDAAEIRRWEAIQRQLLELGGPV
jgi:hypothetical protein